MLQKKWYVLLGKESVEVKTWDKREFQNTTALQFIKEMLQNIALKDINSKIWTIPIDENSLTEL